MTSAAATGGRAGGKAGARHRRDRSSSRAVTTHEPGATHIVELGKALESRVRDVAVSIAARWERTQGFDETPDEHLLRAEILSVTEMATGAVARFLTTGQSPTEEQAAAISQTGRAPVERRLTLAGLTKLYLYWHDAAAAAVREEGSALGTPAATVDEALAVVRAGVDSSLVGMAKQFDIAYLELRAELDEERARLAHRALHDPLTELPNRALFLEQLRSALDPSDRRSTSVALLFVDIDHFKSVNDGAGHSVGDEMLVTVAARLLAAVRPGDIAARLGGDEFVVLCTDLRGGDDEAVAMAERVGAALRAPLLVDGIELSLSASIGVAVARPGDDPDAVLSQADQAMYQAKQDGRACHRVFRHAS